MHLLLPVTQAVHHHLANVGLTEIQGIAGAGIIRVGVRRVTRHHVVAGAVDPLVAVNRASVVAFAGMVVHNVKHHAHAGLMERFHHISEFNVLLILVAGTCVLGVRREKIQGHVSPIVALLRVTLENWH